MAKKMGIIQIDMTGFTSMLGKNYSYTCYILLSLWLQMVSRGMTIHQFWWSLRFLMTGDIGFPWWTAKGFSQRSGAKLFGSSLNHIFIHISPFILKNHEIAAATQQHFATRPKKIIIFHVFPWVFEWVSQPFLNHTCHSWDPHLSPAVQRPPQEKNNRTARTHWSQKTAQPPPVGHLQFQWQNGHFSMHWNMNDITELISTDFPAIQAWLSEVFHPTISHHYRIPKEKP